MPNSTPAQLAAQTALRAQAKRTALALIKHRARAYAKCPMTLENVFPGLAAAEPETMIAAARHLIEKEKQMPQRWFGFGGEVLILNARAVLLLGRARRRAVSVLARAHFPPAASPSASHMGLLFPRGS